MPVKGIQTKHLSDTAIHFVLYGITAIIFIRSLRSKTSIIKSAILSIILASLYGLAIEVLQSAMPWRECSFSDVMANLSGSIFFSVLYVLKEFLKRNT